MRPISNRETVFSINTHDCYPYRFREGGKLGNTFRKRNIFLNLSRNIFGEAKFVFTTTFSRLGKQSRKHRKFLNVSTTFTVIFRYHINSTDNASYLIEQL